MNGIQKVRVGIIGVGFIANSKHIPGYLQSKDSVITAICDTNKDALDKAAQKCGVPQTRCFNDYKDLIACDDVDVVDICTPNYLHCGIADEAIRHGKPFSVEKPMGMNYKETMETCKKADLAGVPGFMCFSWRYRSYMRFMKHLIDNDEIGELYHIYIRCIRSSGLIPNRKLEWRFDTNLAGYGVLGDLGSHMFDITRFLGQEFVSVSADTGIIIKQRPKMDSNEIASVTTDDWCNILAKMEKGANATYQISRCTTNIGGVIKVELYGSKGMMIFTEEGGRETLEICTDATDTAGKGRHLITPPESFEAVQSQAFINVINSKDDGLSSRIVEGPRCQRVLDAALKSAKTRRWVDVSEIE